jgi:5'-3' exonuclease
MGIKHFFSGWFKTKFANHIYRLKNGDGINNVNIDNLMIDMNGLFHSSTQKMYQYGNHKPMKNFMNKSYTRPKMPKQVKVFEDICERISTLVNIVKPKKRLLLCVDGPAPLAKQAQQRCRRFVSSKDRKDSTNLKDDTFDSNSLTPGTEFMDRLTSYVDWYIRKRISEEGVEDKDKDKDIWSNLEIIYSNEKNPSEGEHKLLSYCRLYGKKSESFCICGMDADLIMLALCSHMPNFWLLREEPMDEQFPYYFINIQKVRQDLIEELNWGESENKENKENKEKYNPEMAINDFVFMCFTVGNDFLPHIPGIEIIEGGIQLMFTIYKEIAKEHGHLLRKTKGGLQFKRRALHSFFKAVSQYEKQVFDEKANVRNKFFKDCILENNISFNEEKKCTVDMSGYMEEYYETKFEKGGAEDKAKDKDKDKEKDICHSYLEGMQWVLSYYTQGVQDWNWRYPYNYAPFCSTLSKHVKSYSFKTSPVETSPVKTGYVIKNKPTLPFIQLLMVLPPKSSNLLPEPLGKALCEELKEYNPEEFEIDLSGKRREWEGTVILPRVDIEKVEEVYLKHLNAIHPRHIKRNVFSQNRVYYKCDHSYTYKSYYGDFICKATTKIIDF